MRYGWSGVAGAVAGKGADEAEGVAWPLNQESVLDLPWAVLKRAKFGF